MNARMLMSAASDSMAMPSYASPPTATKKKLIFSLSAWDVMLP
jgi:hypothetical protein